MTDLCADADGNGTLRSWSTVISGASIAVLSTSTSVRMSWRHSRTSRSKKRGKRYCNCWTLHRTLDSIYNSSSLHRRGFRSFGADQLCFSLAAATILRITYGVKVENSDSRYVTLARNTIEAAVESAIPGAFLVDLLPFRQFARFY